MHTGDGLPVLVDDLVLLLIGPQFTHVHQGGTPCPGGWLGSGFSEEQGGSSKGTFSSTVPFPVTGTKNL